MITITGIFDNQLEANRAVTELLNEGISNDDISLLMSDKTHKEVFSSNDEEGEQAKAGVAGAVVGGGLGALLAGLTAVGSIVLPGSGLLMAGPLVAAWTGAGVGAALGGLSGALIRMGFPTNDAKRYEEEINAGKAVVIVHTNDERLAQIARSILKHSSIHTQAA